MPVVKYDRNILFLTLPLALLVVIVSAIGLFTPDFYIRETLNWRTQSIGQDSVDLFLVVPVLLISSWFAFRGYTCGLLIWAGSVIYLVYTFLIYCFGVHFNMLFPVYCVTLGLAVYTTLYFVYKQVRGMATPVVSRRLISVTGIYLIVLAILFYMLWLAEVIPAILDNTIPKSLADVGLPTNAVHVIDLSVFLPGMCITGVLLLKRKAVGLMLAPVLLTFFVLMDITIGSLMIIMQRQGLEGNLGIAGVMGALAVFSAVLLILNLRQFGNASKLS